MRLDELAREWEVVVIGAGPAGALTALLLARAGIKVLLVEKESFPRHKVCGGCLNGGVIQLLNEHGIAEVLSESNYVELNQFTLRTRYSSGRLKIGGGVAISRAHFDSNLVTKAINAGATFIDCVSGNVQDHQSESRSVLLCSRESCITVNTKVVILACGLNSRALPESDSPKVVISPHSRVGVGALVRSASLCGSGEIAMVVSSRGYLGMTRLAGEQVDLAAALDISAIKEAGGLARLISSILDECRAGSLQEIRDAEWSGTPPLSRSVRSPASTRLFMVGDCAGYVEPFTGEGINWALNSAALVVPYVKEALKHWTPLLVTKWSNTYRREIVRRQFICRLVSGVLRYPIVLSPLLPVMNRASFACSPLLKMIHHSPIERRNCAVSV